MIEHGFAVFLIWFCVAAFFVRVLSQVYVALYQPPWLPPMNEWYSGLIPYGVLLPALIGRRLGNTALTERAFARRQRRA